MTPPFSTADPSYGYIIGIENFFFLFFVFLVPSLGFSFFETVNF